MSQSSPITVQILQKEYKISCAEEEQEALIESAAMVDQKMQEIRKQGRSVGNDRIAIMAALNIAHELIQNRGGHQQESGNITSELARLREQIEAALHHGRQLELE